jgi:uncharacterized repeat protein (TIGR01451 family)
LLDCPVGPATNSATCSLVLTPCIGITKTCDSTATAGGTVNFSGTVTNCGNVTLTNIVVHDTVPGVLTNVAVTLPTTTLAPHTSLNYSSSYTVPTGFCGDLTNTATVTANTICGVPVGPASKGCITHVPCPPQICVAKLIACFLGTNSTGQEVCGGFSHSATGFKVVTATATNLPAFCYSLTVSNCGPVGLINVSVIDDQYGDLTADFPCVGGVFAPGTSCSFTFKTALASDLTNTVTATGQSVANGQLASAQDFATGHVFEASIACNKLVSSPDDLDGNTNDNHVSFGCGSGPHVVSYSVVVTNTGDADLTNIVITDPTLAALCTLPGPFALPAHQSLVIPLCGNIPFDCGIGGGSPSNTCANPILGSAAGCTVLELSSNSVSITGPPGGIQGDVCIAANGKLSITGSQFVTGNIELGPGATFAKSGSGIIGGTVLTNVDLSAEIAQALATTSFAASLPCTQNFAQLNKSTTITGVVGTNVICVQDVVLNSATITLTGPAGAKFILNVTGKFVLNGTSHIVAGGGVQPKDILYNIIGSGPDVAFTGGGGGTTCCNSSVDGTLLAVLRKINLSPGLVNGQVISAKNISIVSGSSVRCPSTPCTPVSVPNTITIDAEIAVSQSNTNINPACVLNVNGQPITATSQCSALIECNQ